MIVISFFYMKILCFISSINFLLYENINISILTIAIGNTAQIDQLNIIFSSLNKSIHPSITSKTTDIDANARENLLKKLNLFLLKINIHSIIYNQIIKMNGHTKYKNQCKPLFKYAIINNRPSVDSSSISNGINFFLNKTNVNLLSR